MSKPPVTFGRVKVAGLGGLSSNKGSLSKTARGLGAKQGANTTAKKRSINSNAVTGQSVVTRRSTMAKPTVASNETSYHTVKAPGGKGTTPNNLSRANSPLNAVKPGRRALTKSGVLAKRPNPTNHLPGSPLTKSKGQPTTKAKTKSLNKYGSNASYSPLS